MRINEIYHSRAYLKILHGPIFTHFGCKTFRFRQNTTVFFLNLHVFRSKCLKNCLKIIFEIGSNKFIKKMKRIPSDLKRLVDEREVIFRNNCFDPRLKTHKLHGKQKELYSFSITYSHRIVFEILEEGIVAFIDIGDHEIYK